MNDSVLNDEERSLYAALEELTLMAVNNKGLSAMTDFLSDVYNAPLSIIDSVYNVIAFSKHRLPDDPVIAQELASGHLDIQPSQMIKKMSDTVHTPLKGKSRKMEIPSSSFHMLNYITPIYIRNTVIAFFSVFISGEELSETYEGFLAKFGNVLALEMQKTSFYTSNKSRYFTHLLSTVLENSTPEALIDIGNRFELFGYQLRPYKRVIFLNMQETIYNEADLSLIARKIHRIIPNNIYVLQDSSAVFLSTVESQETFSPDIISKLAQTVQGINAFIGISGEYINIEQTSQYLVQAKETITNAKLLLPEQSVIMFDDIRFCDLIVHASKHTDLKPYQYPPLVRLIHYDEENASNLVETLVCYLEDPHHQPKVCEKLHIHRNTLYYRLDKIKELTGMDIENGYTTAQIFLSLAIISYQTGNWKFLSPF